MAVELLQFQREQLQVNILDPLQEIKEGVGRRLQREEVQIIKSFLVKDIQRESLEKATEGEELVEIIDQHYGKDSLKFIERLLSKAKCHDLVEILHDWKTNNKIMDSNIYHQFGFFPLWIKINYSFNEFSKRRTEIFNTLKKVFAIPQSDGNPASSSECMVYMGISLGKQDVLVCVLVPYCIRQSIRIWLQYEDTALKLQKARVTGIYFSRIQRTNTMSSSSRKNALAGSDLSLSSAMSSDDFGELCDPAYEYINNNYGEVQHSSLLKDYHHKNQNFNNFQNKKNEYEDLIPYTDSAERNFLYRSNQLNSSEPPYREGANTNNGPKLVRANCGYITAPPKIDTASEDSEKLSYGACFFVDRNSSPRKVYREVQPEGSNESVEPLSRTTHSEHQEDARNVYPKRENPERDEEAIQYSQRDAPRSYINVNNSTPERRLRSPRKEEEDILFSRKKEFSFEEPTRFDSDHEKELLDWSRNISQNDREKDEDPSFWYQPRQTTDETSDRREPRNNLENAGGWSLNSSDARALRDGPERKRNTYKTEEEYGSNPGYWQEEEQGCSSYRDIIGYHSHKQVHSNFTDDHMLDSVEDSRAFRYQGNGFGYHGDDSRPSNQAGYQRLSSYGDEQVGSNQKIYMAHGSHRSTSYNGNDWYNENTFQGFMEPEPEPEPSPVTSPLSSEERSGQVHLRHSTQSSSSSGYFTPNHSAIHSSDKISRSMPSLHARNNDMLDAPQPRWSDSRQSNGYHSNNRKHISKYESEADLDDNVFVNTYNNSVKFKVSPPPYCPPPDYQESMIRKSYLSLSSASLDSKRMKAKSPLLSSQSVSSIYKEKESLLNRQELQESIRSAEEKQWEILLEKSKELLFAAKVGDEEDVRTLLEEDVDVDYKNEFGHTALMIASREGHLEVIHVLIAHGANMDIQDKYGKSALHEAAWSGKHQVINVLLSSEAEMNCVDEEGRTPLQYASLRGKTKVVEVLLRFGAEDSILNKDGESAVEIAYRCRHKDIVKMLLKSTDKKTRKNMKGKIRKQRIQRITTATSLPNLAKGTSVKTLRRSRSKPDMNKKGTCVIQ